MYAKYYELRYMFYNKKAELSQRRPRVAPNVRVP